MPRLKRRGRVAGLLLILAACDTQRPGAATAATSPSGTRFGQPGVPRLGISTRPRHAWLTRRRVC